MYQKKDEPKNSGLGDFRVTAALADISPLNVNFRIKNYIFVLLHVAGSWKLDPAARSRRTSSGGSYHNPQSQTLARSSPFADGDDASRAPPLTSSFGDTNHSLVTSLYE